MVAEGRPRKIEGLKVVAQDNSNTPDVNTKDVDLDDIEVDILVIAKTPNKLNPAAAFLTRRGWPTTVIGSVSKAIEYIAEHKPDFVLISLNHQSPAIAKLPELIATTFSATCVGFIESIDAASSSKLNKSKIQHKISGQPSGPSLHRSLRRILAERLNINLDDKGGESAEKTAQAASNTTIKGEGRKASDGGVIIQGSSAGPEKESGPAHIKGEEVTEASGTSEKEILSTGKYTLSKPMKRSLKELTRQGGAGAGDPLLGTLEGAGPGSSLSGIDTGIVGPDGKSTILSEAELAEAKRAHAKELANKLKKSLFGAVTEEAPKNEGPRTMMEKLVVSALNQVCDEGLGETRHPIGEVDRIGVFPIDSPTNPGYLVLATSVGPKDGEELFRKIEAVLLKQFVDTGLPGRLEAGFWISIPEIEFASLANEKASFQLTVMHQGAEVGAAFFRTEKALPQLRELDELGMVSVDIDEISTEQPVTFKAYLHFRANEKYFLYLRNGRRLQKNQKDRLQNHNVVDFFMKRVDKENVRTFLAAAFLTELIRSLKNAA